MSRRSFSNTVDRRTGHQGEDWRKASACRDEDPELFFAVGTSGPALQQIEEAKAVCRRCPIQVKEQCLQWSLDQKIEYGVWGGLSEEERRAHQRRLGQRVIRTVTS